MNSRQLLQLGLPEEIIADATQAVRDSISTGSRRGKDVKELIRAIVASPGDTSAIPISARSHAPSWIRSDHRCVNRSLIRHGERRSKPRPTAKCEARARFPRPSPVP